jgi:hypothetical protein
MARLRRKKPHTRQFVSECFRALTGVPGSALRRFGAVAALAYKLRANVSALLT